MDVNDHDIVCPRSLPCLAGALLMLPVAESTRLLRRWQASCSLIRLIRSALYRMLHSLCMESCILRSSDAWPL